MLVFWKEKLVVLAVPKTGTTALSHALAPVADIAINDPPELKHAPVYRYNRFFRPMFKKACGEENLELMALMREPVSWLGSWYRYRQRPFLDGKATSTKGISFEEFVLEYIKGDDRSPFANVGNQAKFLEPRPNGTKVNHLFRYEAFEEAVSFLEDRLGRKIDVNAVNKSPNRELALSRDVMTQLETAFPEDFELYHSLSRSV